MLLVDDHQPEVGQRREHGRPRADADAGLAAAQARPLVVALAVGELGVQHGDGVAEAGHEARDDLGRQGDLGHEDEHGAPPLERRAGGMQVDLGLARAGHPLQEQHRAGGRGPDRRQRGALVGRERGRLALGADREVRRGAADRALLDGHEAARLQAPQRGQVAPGEARKRPEERTLAVGQALVAGVARGLGVGRRLRPRALGRQQQAEGAGGRRAVVAGQPQAQVDQLGGQARIEDLPGLREIVLAGLGGGGDDADDVAVGEGHDEDRADAHALGAGVVERPAERAGRRQRLDLGHGGHRRMTIEPRAAGPGRARCPAARGAVGSRGRCSRPA